MRRNSSGREKKLQDDGVAISGVLTACWLQVEESRVNGLVVSTGVVKTCFK